MQRDKEAYELCEGVKWSYQDEEGKKHLSAFKDLHHLALLGNVIKNITPENPGSSQLIPSEDELIRVLNVQWKIVNNELLELCSNYKIKSLTNYQAKPFIKDLVMLDELQAFPEAMVDVFQKLVPEAEFNGILTGLFQCLDLHQRNLAVVPVANREYKKFQHLKFFVPSENSTLSFNQLILHYLDGRIEDREFVQFKLDGVLRSSRIIEESDLLKALSVDWKFVIFDTDLSIGEDNLLQFQRRDLCCEHLIPLRSILLEIEWKDDPLKEETIQLLRDSEKNDRLIAGWAQRADAPVRKRLSASLQKEIDQLFVHFGTDSLSSFRIDSEDFTLQELQGVFVEEFCYSEDPGISDLWVRIEEELNFPGAVNGFSIADDKGRIDTQRIDLTSSTETADKNRRKIAMQLFPRLSCRQQEALFQRQKSMRDYLRNYDELVNSELEDQELYTQLSNYLSLKETPLNIIEKNQYLYILKCAAASSDYSRELIQLYNEICEKCQPTYFNLMKAMYPLLADAFELYTVTVSRLEYLQNHSDLETKSDEQLAGQAIGCYSAPLEEAIKIAKEKFPTDNEYYILAEMIELAIINKENPSYFGSWKK